MQENCKVQETVILSVAKNLVGPRELTLLPRRFFATLRMTAFPIYPRNVILQFSCTGE